MSGWCSKANRWQNDKMHQIFWQLWKAYLMDISFQYPSPHHIVVFYSGIFTIHKKFGTNCIFSYLRVALIYFWEWIFTVTVRCQKIGGIKVWLQIQVRACPVTFYFENRNMSLDKEHENRQFRKWRNEVVIQMGTIRGCVSDFNSISKRWYVT